jgi:glycosyltransferase involved in cell wall biosynthesis
MTLKPDLSAFSDAQPDRVARPVITSRPLVFDATHLVTRLSRRATSGIDRVDLAYARYFAGRIPPLAAATQYGLFRPHLFGAARLRSLIDHFERQQLERECGEQSEWQSLRMRLAPPVGKAGQGRNGSIPAPASPGPYGLARLLRIQLGFRVLHDWRATIPHGAIYLNAAQHALEHHRFFRWLSRRSDVVPVFLVHDLLPLDVPEFFPDGYERRFERRVETIVRRAPAIIATTWEVAQRIAREYCVRGLAPVPIHVEPLASPLEQAADIDSRDAAFLDGISYFVAVSTIEPRKNHALLIQVWRALIQKGRATPKLVIVGKRGWENQQTFRELDLAPDLRPHVIEVPSLPSAHLRSLIQHAQAVLMPSFAEGYGLPIVEALTLGTPVVCSDIPVFREVSQDKALAIPPLDGMGWLAAIEALSLPDSPLRAKLTPGRGSSGRRHGGRISKASKRFWTRCNRQDMSGPYRRGGPDLRRTATQQRGHSNEGVHGNTGDGFHICCRTGPFPGLSAGHHARAADPAGRHRKILHLCQQDLFERLAAVRSEGKHHARLRQGRVESRPHEVRSRLPGRRYGAPGRAALRPGHPRTTIRPSWPDRSRFRRALPPIPVAGLRALLPTAAAPLPAASVPRAMPAAATPARTAAARRRPPGTSAAPTGGTRSGGR